MGFYKKKAIRINRENIESTNEVIEDLDNIVDPLDIAQVQKTSNNLTDAVDGCDDLSNVADEVNNKLETVEEHLQEDNVDPIDVAVVQESINNFYRTLGLDRNTVNISTESIKADPSTHMQGLKLELEGLGDTIKEYAKKAWDKILEFFRKVKEYFKKMFLKLQMAFKKEKADANKSKSKEELEYEKFCDDVVAAAEKKLGYSITPVSFIRFSREAYQNYKGVISPTGTDLDDTSYQGKFNHWVDLLVEHARQNPLQPDYLYTVMRPRDTFESCNKMIDSFEFLTNTIKTSRFNRIDDMETGIINAVEKLKSAYDHTTDLYNNTSAFRKAFNLAPDVDIVTTFPITGLKLCIVTAEHKKTEYFESYLNLKADVYDITLNNRLSINMNYRRFFTINNTVSYLKLYEEAMSGYDKTSGKINKIESNILGIKNDVEKVYGQPDIDKSVRKVIKDLNTVVKIINHVIESYYNYNSYLVSIVGKINNLKSDEKLYEFY